MASPRPTPTALKIAKGNPGKRPLNLLEPQPSRQLPACPDYLPEGAKAAWNSLVPELCRIGVLTKIDMNLVERYCLTFHWWREAVVFVLANGKDLVVTDPNSGEVKGVVPSPYPKRISGYAAELLRMEQEMGMTPSSRTKIHVSAEDSEDDLEAQIRSMRIAN